MFGNEVLIYAGGWTYLLRRLDTRMMTMQAGAMTRMAKITNEAINERFAGP